MDTNKERKLKEGLADEPDANQQLIEMMHRLNDVELSYLPIERESMIPDDYSFFLSRNETILENATNSKTFVPTQYKWVHLSCATWIPGPIVTPKTAVRLNKMDEKRFTLQCIICFKKDGACM